MNKFRKLLPPLASLLPFEATARLGSVTRAAEELNLTQAAVSRQIRALEENLGAKLFVRRNRAVFLTDDGKELQHSVSSGLETIAASVGQLRRSQKSNEVILFAQLCEGLYWLMPNLSRFYQQHKNIEIKVSVSTQPLTQAAEIFDLALQTTGRSSGDSELIFTAPDEIFPVCSPGYLANSEIPFTTGQLIKHRLLHHKAHPQDWLTWDDWLEKLGIGIRVGFEGSVYDSYPIMIQSAIEGHGVALGWKQTTKRLIKSGLLVTPFQETLELKEGLSVYQHPNCKQRPAVDNFVQWLQHELQRL